jgi:hypothetical protein
MSNFQFRAMSQVIRSQMLGVPRISDVTGETSDFQALRLAFTPPMLFLRTANSEIARSSDRISERHHSIFCDFALLREDCFSHTATESASTHIEESDDEPSWRGEGKNRTMIMSQSHCL